MKTVLLAGGLGTRLAEETDLVPKPMVEVGGLPILFHIMRGYAHWGFNDFVVCLGYKSEVIKRFFLDYHLVAQPSLRVDMKAGEVDGDSYAEVLDWHVHLLETGLSTQTAGRIRQAMAYTGDETFMMTYGDGVSDIPIRDLLDFHRSHGKIATLTVVRPKSLYGHMVFDGDQITEFIEKPQRLGGWINGGFMVFEPEVLEYLGRRDDVPLEKDPFESLARAGQLMAYQHEGFWQSMDSVKDKRLLEQLWDAGDAPWWTSP